VGGEAVLGGSCFEGGGFPWLGDGGGCGVERWLGGGGHAGHHGAAGADTGPVRTEKSGPISRSVFVNVPVSLFQTEAWICYGALDE
jgi:hypothetical protein